MGIRGGWILEVDIRKFFDNLDHAHLRELVQCRVRDGVLSRLIGKWLTAGVLEEGVLRYPESGSPQGGVISPILSNVYLHDVLDVWFEEVVKPRLRGQAFLIRYADDFVMGFACEEDARRVMEVLPKRFGKDGLATHPEKSRLVPFVGRPLRSLPTATPAVEPGTFDFLGLTHLGTHAEGERGRQASYRSESLSSCRQEGGRMVPCQSSPTDRGTARHTESEVERSLRLLWHHREHTCPGPIP